MAYTLTIGVEQNGSLGTCWLLKAEDGASLIDKCLYPASDYSAADALDRFMEECGLSRDDIGEAYAFDVDDPRISEFARDVELYGARPAYAVEYRDMGSAIHHLAVFGDEAEADGAYEAVFAGDPGALSGAVDDIEIDFRDVEFDGDCRNQWFFRGIGETYIIVNVGHLVPDLH